MGRGSGGVFGRARCCNGAPCTATDGPAVAARDTGPDLLAGASESDSVTESGSTVGGILFFLSVGSTEGF